VRADERACPFCKSTMPSVPIAPPPVRRVVRMAFAVATTSAALSCGKTTAPDASAPTEPSATVAVPLYGGTPLEMPDATAAIAAYGAPPIRADAAPADAGPKPQKK
jgi:hypothetical protein